MIERTAQAFFNAWIETVTSRREELLAAWRKRGAYTNIIKGDDSCVLKEVAAKLDLRCYPRDYYHIDAVMYYGDDLVPGIKADSFWFTGMAVAFEHENQFDWGLYREVSHLLLINADLKVLVTYPNGDDEPCMNYLHRVIKSSRAEADISSRKNFLVILGYENGFEWHAYIYQSDKWHYFDHSP